MTVRLQCGHHLCKPCAVELQLTNETFKCPTPNHSDLFGKNQIRLPAEEMVRRQRAGPTAQASGAVMRFRAQHITCQVPKKFVTDQTQENKLELLELFIGVWTGRDDTTIDYVCNFHKYFISREYLILYSTL